MYFRDSDESYIDRIISSRLKQVLRVKIADLKENMDLKRIDILIEKDLECIKNYPKTYWPLKALDS